MDNLNMRQMLMTRAHAMSYYQISVVQDYTGTQILDLNSKGHLSTQSLSHLTL